ncbi:PREDICTED: uncharacterized protein LOC105448746 [Wasmannia auropunctata]|uniref:uncharacterized protein LOC105448746 n=1 Tax=Wasmannia auropunctata TaxID=64793 RepID=UPI0005EFC5F8|nr:PREDICTED: uncharacterized protein LOC105448746 [Wasmannia auropunctata]
MDKLDQEIFSENINVAMSTLPEMAGSGAELYESWYNKVIECALVAGAKVSDGSGGLKFFDANKKRMVETHLYNKSTNAQYNNHNKYTKQNINKPWWDEECRKAIEERRLHFRNLSIRPSRENLLAYRIASQSARKEVLEYNQKV